MESLRWEDQEKIKGNIGGTAEPKSSKTTKGSKATASAAAEDPDLIAEYAKSSRSSCKGCGDKIEKVIFIFDNLLLLFVVLLPSSLLDICFILGRASSC